MPGNASGIRAGRAYVEVGAENSALERGLKQAEARLKAFGSSVMSVGRNVAGLGAGITAPFLGAAKVFADAGSTLNDAAARTGMSVEALSALGHAAQQTGTDLTAVEGGVRKMQKALVAGSEENLAAASTFAALGLSVEQLMKLSPDQQFEAVAKAIAKIPNPTAKAGAAMQIFGKSSTVLVPMIDDLAALTSEAKKFGLVWTGDQAKQADAFGDAMDLLRAVLSRVVSLIGSSLQPMLTDLAMNLATATKRVMDFVSTHKSLIVVAFKAGVVITGVGAALLAIGATIATVGAGLGVLATVFTGIATAIGVMLSPVGLLIVGLVAATTGFVRFSTLGQQAMEGLKDGFGSLLATAQEAFKGIADALRAGDISLAAQILWAGLKVEFLKGLNFLRSAWADWGVAVTDVFRGVSFGYARLMLDGIAFVESKFAGTVSVLQTLFADFVAGLQKSWNSFGGFFAKVWERIKALFSGKDIEAEIQRINDEVAAKNAAIDQGTAGRKSEIEATRQGKVDKINADLAEQQKSVNDQQEAENEARRQAAQKGLEGAADALAKAQAELDALVGKAGKEAAATKIGGIGTRKGPGPEDLAGIEAGIGEAAAKAKVDVSGSFSAAALKGLGAGQSVQDDQLKEQKKHTDYLAQLNRKAKIGGLVFGT